MSSLRAFKQKLATISRLWEQEEYDAALAEVESLRETWPGNAHLNILWASLVQLQENPSHDLTQAKQALRDAVELDGSSRAAAIELGNFLDNVEDDPQAAAKAYAEGVACARQWFIEGLLGQAKALLQLHKREEALRCLFDILHLARQETKSKKQGPNEAEAMLRLDQMKGPHAEQIQELLNELSAQRSGESKSNGAKLKSG